MAPTSARSSRVLPLLFGAVAVCFALVLLEGSGHGSIAHAAECQPGDYRDGSCPSPTVRGGIVNGDVELDGSITAPGSSRGRSGGSGGNRDSVTGPCPQPGVACQGLRDGYSVTPAPATPVSPVTLNDLVNFRPTAGTQHMEPNGWMIVGLNTNFYAAVEVRLQNGQLLGRPASVRFTPIGYHWTYGDGASANRATQRATWAALGVPEFDATPTSHLYQAAGTYNIDLVIEFSAEYRFSAGSWIAVAGTIPVPANWLVAAASEARTVLVERDCGRSRPGPGC